MSLSCWSHSFFNGPRPKRSLLAKISPALGLESLETRLLLSSQNTAPVLDTHGNPTLTSIQEDAPPSAIPGTLVSQIIANLTSTGGSISDPDPGALQGLAITRVDNSHGTWQYTLNNGVDWQDFGTPTAATARLLAPNPGTKIRFLPLPDFNGKPTLLFVAWDQTVGVNGGTAVATNRGGSKAFSVNPQYASISVAPVNDAPVFNASGEPTLYPIFQSVSAEANHGTHISRILSNLADTGGSISDIDAGTLRGIAVTFVDQTHGTWQYTTNNGTDWLNFGSPNASQARLLASNSNTSVRFLPDPEFYGNANFVFVAWDQSAGTNGGTAVATNRGGTKPFSLGYDNAVISVKGVNRAPLLNDAGSPALPDVDSELPADTNNGISISSLLASMTPGGITDPDLGALKGIAVTAAAQTNGTWQFSLDNGTHWLDIGTPSVASARLLAASDATRIRFVPPFESNGISTLRFVAWDRTSGTNGGTASATLRGNPTPFSLAFDSATVTFTATTNHAPVLNTSGIPTLTPITVDVPAASNPGTSVAQIITNLTNTGGSITDADPDALQGIAITRNDQTNGTWQFSTSNGASWTNFGSPTASTARLLAADANTRIRFLPVADFHGIATFIFVAWDQTEGTNGGTGTATNRGGSEPYSTAYETGSIAVLPVLNHAPVLTGDSPELTPIQHGVPDTNNPGTLVSQFIANLISSGGGIADSDPGALRGIAITAADNNGGTWQYSIDNGSHWLNFGKPTLEDSRLLASDSITRIRFLPKPDTTGIQTFLFAAWDQNSGTNGGTGDAYQRGGNTAFSDNILTAKIDVIPGT